MDYTFKELKRKNVSELREIASGIEHEAVQGYTQLNKDHLLEAICKAIGCDMHEHHQIVGINKSKMKAQIKALKKDRDQFLDEHNHVELKKIRKEIKKIKNQLRKAMV